MLTQFLDAEGNRCMSVAEEGAQLDWGNGMGMDTEIVRFVHFVQSGIYM